jgi:hypothetical protein
MTTRQIGTADPARPTVRLLQSPIRHVLPRTMVLLRYVSATGATIILAVQAAQDAGRLVVLVGQADKKRWWRHFRNAAAAEVWLGGLGAFLGFATPLWRPGQSVALIVAIGVVGGLLMAAVTSAITGLAVRRLLR